MSSDDETVGTNIICYSMCLVIVDVYAQLFFIVQ